MLKNYQNTLYPRFKFIPKSGIEFPKKEVLFLQLTISYAEVKAETWFDIKLCDEFILLQTLVKKTNISYPVFFASV